jgi:[NiFe] hydrogenase diaphorase moiety large subunit
MVGAEHVQAVQVGGPSGSCIGPNDFERILGYEDLATGGSLIIINNRRDILKDIVLNFTNFFIEESCGSCTPCRTLPVLFKDKLIKIIEGKGVMQDLMDIERWSAIMKANRCGLGHTALNPILSTVKNFRHLYLNLIQKETEFDTGFRLEAAMKDGRMITNRH